MYQCCACSVNNLTKRRNIPCFTNKTLFYCSKGNKNFGCFTRAETSAILTISHEFLLKNKNKTLTIITTKLLKKQFSNDSLSFWYRLQAWLLSSASKYHSVMAYRVLKAGWTSCGFLLSDQKNRIRSNSGSMSATWSCHPSGNIRKRPPFFCKNNFHFFKNNNNNDK